MSFAATRDDALSGQVTPGPRRGQVPRKPHRPDITTDTRLHAGDHAARMTTLRQIITGATNAA